MQLFGKLFLRFIRAFQFWHEHNEEVSLLLLVVGGLAFLLSAGGVISAEHGSAPLGWEHVLGLVTTGIFALYLLLRTLGKLLAHFWPPPVVIGITKTAKPAQRREAGGWLFEDGKANSYRYRYARNEDLDVFCKLAMSDPAIVTTYAYLDEHAWKGLYARWLDANPHNLMVLERLGGSACPNKISAVSIVVPLTVTAARDLWAGAIGTVDIERVHLAPKGHRAEVLLLDFVAADRDVRALCPELVFSLPKVHLAKQGLPWAKRRVEVWIEPVHRALPKMLEQIGFEGPHRTAKGHTLYKLAFPVRTKLMTVMQRETCERLQEDLRECAEWQIGQ